MKYMLMAAVIAVVIGVVEGLTIKLTDSKSTDLLVAVNTGVTTTIITLAVLSRMHRDRTRRR